MSSNPPEDRMQRQRQQFEQNFGFTPTRENVKEHVIEGLADADWIEFPLTEEFDWTAELDEAGLMVGDLDMVVVWALNHLDDAGGFPHESPEDVANALVGWMESEGVFE